MRAAREGNVLLVVLLAASAAAGAGPRLQVRHDGDARVTVRYELEEPVTELRFLVDQPDVRWLVNLDYVRVQADEPARITLANAYDSARGECVASYDVSFAPWERDEDAIGRYVMVSDTFETCVARARQSDGLLFFSEDVTPALADGLSGSLRAVYGDLRHELGVAPAERPVIFLTWIRSSERESYQGDTGWRSVITLRLYGEAWGTPGDRRRIDMLTYLAHELTHLWIGKKVAVDDGDGLGHAWLREGAAEYVALLTLLRRGDLPEAAFRQKLGSRMGSCFRDLGSRALLTERQPAGGQVIYDCGMLVQFVYDLVTRAESEGEETVIDLWRHIVMRSHKTGSRSFRSAAFVGAPPAARELLGGLLYGPQVDSAGILEGLRTLGVDAAMRDAADFAPWAAAILMPLLRAHCEAGPFGFYTYENALEARRERDLR